VNPPKRCAAALVLLTAALRALSPQPALAGSFFVEEQSVSGSGRALAGQSALGEDASTLFYNPANVTLMPAMEIALGSYFAFVHADLDDEGSAASTFGTTLSGAGPARVRGSDGGNPLGMTLLGSVALAMPLRDERTWLGLGVSAPFGIESDYGNDWFGRYSATRTDLRVIDVNPTLGFVVNESLSLGATLTLRHSEADFRSALPDPFASEGPSRATDGAVSVKGDDWDVGYALGLRYAPRPGTRIGLAYRSGTHADLEGRARFSGLSGPLAARNGSIDASTTFGLPDIVLLGVAQEVTPQLTLLAQLNWFDWSDFEAVRIRLADGIRIVNPQGYHDSWSAALGAEYRCSDRFLLRAGAEFDETPVDADLRSARTPDDDRIRLSAGLTYDLSPHWKLDVSYAHVFVRDSEVRRTDRIFADTPVETQVQTRAGTQASADIVGVAFRYRF
jgi:long-chain fatty acid transport protein